MILYFVALIILLLFVIAKVRHSVLLKHAINELKSHYPVRRWNATIILRKLRSVTSVSQLISALKDKDPYVRKCAVQALGQIRDNKPVPELLKLLSDENWLVREAVIQALGDIAPPDTHTINMTLEYLTNDRDRYARIAAVVALKKLKSNQKLLGRARLVALRTIGSPIIGLSASFTPSTKIKKNWW